MKFDTALNLSQMPESIGKLPSGTYFATIKTAEICISKMNINNEYIKVQWLVIDGAMQDRTCYQNINYRNENKVAENIGLSMLRKIMSIGQIMSLADTDQLIGIMADIVVEHQDPNEKNGFMEIVNVKDVKHHGGTPTPLGGFASSPKQAMPKVQSPNPFVNPQPQVAKANNPFFNTGIPTQMQNVQNVQPQQIPQPQQQVSPQSVGFGQGPESFIGDDIPTIDSFVKK